MEYLSLILHQVHMTMDQISILEGRLEAAQQEVEFLRWELEQERKASAKLLQELKEEKQKVERLSLNPNFATLTRVAGFMRAVEVLTERRKSNSGALSMLCVDIAGMGLSNSRRGEVATNIAMRELLSKLRESAEAQLDHQLNSGDEFVFYVPTDDAVGLSQRLDHLAKIYGFDGAYCSSLQIPEGVLSEEGLEELANRCMEGVYQIKALRKGQAK